MKKVGGPARKKGKSKPIPIVAIGASAGGLEAVCELLKNLPDDTHMAYVYVQHLDPSHESALPEILSRKTKMKVQNARHLLKIRPNNLYLIPHDKNLAIKDGVLTLPPRNQKPVVNMPIDQFFISLAEKHREGSIGVVLSGNGNDGTLGIKSIKVAGGLTFAQDDSAKFANMPKSAIAEGYIDKVLSPRAIAEELGRISKNTGVIELVMRDSLDEDGRDENLAAIMELIKKSTGVDFQHYKINTIRRRIIRRLLLHKLASLADYLKFLKQNINEIAALQNDLLINVTSFFRDPEMSESLKKKIFPKIIKRKSLAEPIRLWVPACSTGEEVYSLAIVITEILGDEMLNRPIQVFASDLSDSAITKARIGLYSPGDLANVSPKRLQRFFSRIDGGYRINKQIRDLCVFAQHNVFSDPPFSKIDLISCCNLMIYLDTFLQKKLLSIFHYALNNDGYLVIGKSESIGEAKYLFSHIGKKQKIYQPSKNASNSSRFELIPRNVPIGRKGAALSLSVQNKQQEPPENNFEKKIRDILLSKYAPASVVINKSMEVLQFHGPVSHFLEISPGKASLNLLKLARPGLAFELRSIINKATKSKKVESKNAIEINHEGIAFFISIEISPINEKSDDGLFLIVFEKMPVTPAGTSKQTSASANKVVKQLQQKLESMKEDMRSILEEQEASNEELQSANEEIISSNEELQSINEELETSKEEVESSNEELVTINSQLLVRNDQLVEANEYAEAVSETIREAVLIIDKDFRVISANKAFYRTFHTKEHQTEGMLLFELGNRQWDILELRKLLEEIVYKHSTINGFEVQHVFPYIGEKVMHIHARTLIQKAAKKHLIILAIEDITDHRKAQRALLERELWFRNMANNAPVMIWVTDALKKRTFVNKTFQDYTGIKGTDWQAIVHPDDLTTYNGRFDKSFKEGENFQFEYRLKRSDGAYRWVLDIARPYFNNEQFLGYLGSTIELHDKRLLYEELDKKVKERTRELRTMNNRLQRSNNELQQFAFVASHDLQEPLRKILTYVDRIKHTEEKLGEGTGTYIDKIDHSSKRMTKLIDDLLDFSRISFDDKKFEDVDLNKTLSDVMLDLDLKIAEKKAEVKWNGDLPTIQAIPLQMSQLFHNLILNALKFAKPNVAPRISISQRVLTKEEIRERKNIDGRGRCVEIVFSDNGIGFDPKFAEQIFIIFQRLNDRKQYPGTGMGLAISKKIVTNHKGDLYATSTEEGASFHVILPVKQSKIQ